MATRARRTTRPIVATYVRLPADLHGELAALAEREERSLNAQIVHLLRKALDRLPKHRTTS